MSILDWDWKAIGAVAGPVLALLSLAWHAREKWRRPFVVATFAWNTGDRPEDQHWAASARAFVRVLNPKPVALLVHRVEVQTRPARRRWRWLPQRPTTGEVNREAVLIAPYGEHRLEVWAPAAYDAREVRVVVRRGRRGWRRLRPTSWSPESPHVPEVRARVEAQRQRA